MKLVIISILILLLSAYVTDAATSVRNMTESVGASMVASGMELFGYSIGDQMYQIGSGSGTINRADAPGMIFQLLTFTIDPYKFQFVQEWQNVMIIFFVMLTLLTITLGAASVLINRQSPDTAKYISWALNDTAFFDIHKWLSTIFMAIIFLLLGTFGLYYLMQLEYVVSAIIAEKALLTAPPVIDNMLIYIIFAFVYLLMSVIMAVRTIIILLAAAGFLGLLALFLIPQTRSFATSAFMYFLVILFLQPTLLFIAAVGLAFISVLPMSLLPFANVLIIGLVLLLLTVSIICILGIGIVKNIIFLSARAVI